MGLALYNLLPTSHEEKALMAEHEQEASGWFSRVEKDDMGFV